MWLENPPSHNITLFSNGRPPLKIVLFTDIRIILLRNKWLVVVTLLRPGICFSRFPFLVSVINCFVCETNRYLCDLAGLFSKIMWFDWWRIWLPIYLVTLVRKVREGIPTVSDSLPALCGSASFSSFRWSLIHRSWSVEFLQQSSFEKEDFLKACFRFMLVRRSLSFSSNQKKSKWLLQYVWFCLVN